MLLGKDISSSDLLKISADLAESPLLGNGKGYPSFPWTLLLL